MKRISDPTGRFAERLYYKNYELDDIAEQLIIEFMIKQYGKLIFPVPTDDLLKLIERDTADLDSSADLADEGEGVQGVTKFFPGKKPKVRIASALWDDRTGHRLRTTLTHEYGHVKLHTPLYDAKGAQSSLDLFPSCCEVQQCHRDTILPAQSGGDWLEWQAGYMSGAFLMPVTHLSQLIDRIARSTGNYESAALGSRYADALINTVKDTYGVSKDAARVRLMQLERIVKTHHQNQTLSF